MEKGVRKMYDKDFKLQAVQMVEEGSQSMTQIAKSLGVNINTLGNWCKEYRKKAASAFRERKGPELTPEQKKIKELEKKLKDTQEGFEILKKAVAIFSKAKE
jgi:transposase